MERCLCGSDNRRLYITCDDRYVYECSKCHYTPFTGSNRKEAQKNWNMDMRYLKRKKALNQEIFYYFNRKGK